jgi:transcriptional regulator with PAS, ATPase and Fis domain
MHEPASSRGSLDHARRSLVSPAELVARCRESEVYRLARPLLERFGADLAPTQSVLALFDAAGCMLFIGGNLQTAGRLAEIDFRPGAFWHEESPRADGSNAAVGRRLREVPIAEHLVAAGQSWCRATAPILARGSAELLGFADITEPWSCNAGHSLTAARAIATAVEERLRSVQILLDQVTEHALRSASGGADGLIAVDLCGRVLAASEAARRRLSLPACELPAALAAALAAALDRRGGTPDEFLIDWPAAGRVALVASPVRHEDQVVGAVVRVPALATASRSTARAPPAMAVARYDFGQILGESAPALRAIALARVASRNELPVVIHGESGTGKEMFAQAIHSASARAGGPFIPMNCGCIPAGLLEAELFGYEAGTFTGGRQQGKAGKFEEASGGTVFLDEVSELSPQAQTALLRVLQEREVVRLGGSSPRPVNIRIVAASNKSLPDEIRAGRFRSDLFFRLNVLSIVVPPLRDRRADIPRLAQAFLMEAEGQIGRSGLTVSEAALRVLKAYSWPGNVRELRNAILRAAATATGDVIEAQDLPEDVQGCARSPASAPPPASAPAPARTPAPEISAAVPLQARSEPPARETLVCALETWSWNVARTAQALRVSRMTLYRWLRKYGIERWRAAVGPRR